MLSLCHTSGLLLQACWTESSASKYHDLRKRHSFQAIQSKPPPQIACPQSYSHMLTHRLWPMQSHKLSVAIAESHGSDTATWLTQAAEACLDLGLKASTFGLQLKPVSFQAVTVQMKIIAPTVKRLLAKLQGSTGQKYFSLFGPPQAPTTMLLKLHSIVLVPGRTASVLTLLQKIDVASGGNVPDASVLQPLIQSYVSGTPEHASAMPKEAEAKRQLKAAVQAQHASSTDAAKFTAAIASAAIELGLKSSSSSQAGFVLTCVVFTKVGVAIAGMKRQSSCASMLISDIIQKLYLQQYFTFVADAKSEKHLTVHIAAVLPHPSSSIRRLLPNAPWSLPSLSATASISALPAVAATSSSLQALCADSSPGPVASRTASRTVRTIRLTKAKQNAQGSARSGQSDDPLQNRFKSSANADGVNTILNLLPEGIKVSILQHLTGRQPDSGPKESLVDAHTSREEVASKMHVEVVADKGRPVVIRFSDGSAMELPDCMHITDALAKLTESVDHGDTLTDLFYADNRLGVEGTLHRISAIRNRDKHRSVIGLTYRVGRHMPGVANLMLDILAQMQCGGGGGPEGAGAASLLLVGPPGVGKTTLLRDIVSLLANKLDKRVVVVDTSSEIGGDGAAVQNHNPQVVVVDEIGSSDEVRAVKSIAQRGVMLVGTAHAVSLSSLISNPELNTLVGCVHQVVIGDKLARFVGAHKSSVASPPLS
ncbi:TPA: PFAM ATPase associated with various cellular activities (AAA) [Trebouxia sp. C0004]